MIFEPIPKIGEVIASNSDLEQTINLRRWFLPSCPYVRRMPLVAAQIFVPTTERSLIFKDIGFPPPPEDFDSCSI